MTRRPPRLPLVLLAILTLFTFAGPLAVGLALRGGEHDLWPPDGPVENWWVGGIVGAYLIVMASCLTTAYLASRKSK